MIVFLPPRKVAINHLCFPSSSWGKLSRDRPYQHCRHRWHEQCTNAMGIEREKKRRKFLANAILLELLRYIPRAPPLVLEGLYKWRTGTERNVGNSFASERNVWNCFTSSCRPGVYGIIYRISLASVMSASCDCCWQAGWPLVGELANFQCHPSEEYVGFAPHHILHTGFFPERVRRTNRRNITSRMK